jgi:isocitrate/isopropylmalate dehydrogenase
LGYLGEKAAADNIRAALRKVLKNKEGLTPDIGGTGNTDTFTKAMLRAIKDRRP